MNLLALGVLGIIVALLPVSQGQAASVCDPWIAEVVSVQGHIEAKRHAQTHWLPVQLNDTYCAGDSIRTTLHSRAGLLLRNQTVLRLDQGTAIVLPEFKPERPAWLELIRGAAHIISNIPYKLNVNTPFVNAAIEGTEFAMRVTEKDTRTWVFEGTVVTENAHGRLSLKSGDASIAEAGQAPVPLIVIKPRDAVQWALYYPPIIDYRPAASPDPFTQQALDLYRSGQTAKAIASLENIPHKLQDAHYFTLRAGLLLSVGRVAQARDDIHQAQTLEADNGTALALLSIINLAQNDKQQALDLALEAARKDPQSPIPQVALSYAYQATFDIEKARDSIKQALELSAEDPLAWARLSELELSLGELDNALEAAEKATALNPALSRTQMVLGFAYLTKIDLDEASQAFKKAIELDPAAPLPRLGQGLAKIRRGDVKEGTKDIGVAAILDPDNSLVRSYLGKAYYEEKREGVASREFAIAKELDPKDPTPWFYDAILKQTTNRPMEALHDMQKAIELNDNRAVYRSSLLLDRDLAARSAAIGRIYNDLGFEQLGLLEGWKSLNVDPSNYSSHRLLADNYKALPRHEIARVSELLQSQLLQPINLTPVQPQLAETNLLIFDGLGPASPSFNEFNPLFVRNRFSLQASGIVGSDETYGDEIVHAGLWDSLSYSLGQFHYQTEGFRPNSDLDTNLYTAFIQAKVSTNMNLQFEYRRENTKSGDLRQLFNPDLLTKNRRQTLDRDSVRLGFNLDIDSNTNLLGFITYGKLDKNIKSPGFESFLFLGLPLSHGLNTLTTGTDNLKNWSNEIQVIGHWNRFNLITGAGYVNQHKIRTTEFTATLTSPSDLNSENRLIVNQFLNNFNQTQKESSNEHHAIGYLYSTTKVFKGLDLTMGTSCDYINRDSSEGSQLQFKRKYLNPKLGLVWKPFDSTTLRAAWFKTVKRAFASNQTIEPTHVSGFTQFFDDPDSARSTRFGFGIDQQLSSELRMGSEISWRDITSPRFINGTNSKILFIHQKENSHRAYLYWTATQNIAFSAEYFFQSFDRTDSPEGSLSKGVPFEMKTHKVPLTLTYYNNNGLFGNIIGSFIDQSVTLSDGRNRGFRGHDHFWVADALIGYRLPKRWGIINLSIQNIFDQKFNIQEENFNIISSIEGGIVQPKFSPKRTVFARITIAF